MTRATHVLHRQFAHALPVAVGGRGVEIFDSEGRSYLDASGGAAVSCLGHAHPDGRCAGGQACGRWRGTARERWCHDRWTARR